MERNACVWCLLNKVEAEDRKRKKILWGREARVRLVSKRALMCIASLLLMMIQINICTRGTDNGDIALVSHLGGYMEDVSCLQNKDPLPGEEVPDFSGTHRVLQCCTLASVISHKASLILYPEQLRGLWSEIKRCTIHFLCITSLIIHLNCSETLSRAKCQTRCWLEMCGHVYVKGWAWQSKTDGVCLYVSIGSHRVQWYEGRAGLVTDKPDVHCMSRCMGNLQSSVSIGGVQLGPNYTADYSKFKFLLRASRHGI